MLSGTLAIVLIALTASACSSSRQVVSTEVRAGLHEQRDSVRRDSVVVAVHDTIMETTTIHVQTNEAGDTLRVAQVTDRTRAVARDRVRAVQERVVVRTDTLYIEKRDSVYVETPGAAGGEAKVSAVVASLRWIFWIVLLVTVLVFILKFRRF